MSSFLVFNRDLFNFFLFVIVVTNCLFNLDDVPNPHLFWAEHHVLAVLVVNVVG